MVGWGGGAKGSGLGGCAAPAELELDAVDGPANNPLPGVSAPANNAGTPSTPKLAPLYTVTSRWTSDISHLGSEVTSADTALQTFASIAGDSSLECLSSR